MAKKSQRRIVRYEKDKSSCMWGFMSMFDFRHGQSTRKLIADKRRSSKLSGGSVHSKNKFDVLNNMDEDCQGTFDNGESKRSTVKTIANTPSVKKLIEEEMFTDQIAMKDVDNSQVESKESRQRRQVFMKLDSKRKKKTAEKKRDITDDLDTKSETSHRQHSRKQSKDNLDVDTIIEEFCNLKDVYSMMHGNDEVKKRAQPNQKQKHGIISEKNSRDAIREFVNQIILNGKDPVEARKFLFSDELMEALQLISSDKELFLAFLQNPNPLVLKCVQEFENSQGANNNECSHVTGSKLSEQDRDNREQTNEIVNHKKNNFFRKKLKSQSKSSTNENEKTDISNRIVVLKPGSIGSEDSAKGSSHFSLTEIKKKLKHAIGRERHGNLEGISNKGPINKAIVKDNVGMRSPNKDHFFFEKIARISTGKNIDSEAIVEKEKGIYPKQGVSNLYIEAKKHLCEITGNQSENMDLSSREISKTLGRILSFPDYNFSPLESPGRDWEHHFVTAKTRLSNSDKSREANKDILSPKQATFVGHLDQKSDIPEKQSSIHDESSNNYKSQEIKSDSNFSDGKSHIDEVENYCPVRDEIVTEGDAESAKEITILESSSEPVGLSTRNEDQSIDISEVSDSARCSHCLEQQDVTEDNQSSSPLSSPSHSSITSKAKEQESITDVSGRPSPVSVLDAPFLEDDASSQNSSCQPADVSVRPLHVEFEEQDFTLVNQIKRAKYCIKENELMYKYIEAVLQASGLTRDQLLMKCLSSDKILDPSLFDQVEFSPNRLFHDQKLLSDCINEILMEVCCDYFGASPFVSFVSPIMRPTPNMKTVILMVWEGVSWHLLPMSPPHTLDKIVRKDMEKSGAWMDLRFEAETVGFEICDAILAELMEDTILSCVSNSPDVESYEHNNDKNSADV